MPREKLPDDERKQRYRAARDRWDAEHISRISVAMPTKLKETLDDAAASVGEPRNRFVTTAIQERIDKLFGGENDND